MSKHVKIIPPPNIPNISAAEARLQRISRDILPLTPYLLTVPSLYNLSSHQVNDWKRGCPFDAKEERLQYLTFRSHFDKDTIFHAVGDWDDGKGNILSTIDRTSGLSSPLPGQPPKKKMSFLDYKNKAAGHASTRQTPAKADGEVETAESGDTTTLLSQKSPNPSSNQKPHGTKRPANTIFESKDTKSGASTQSPPAKKVRVPSNVAAASQATKIEMTALWDLPPMLSPTLPRDIEEELAKLREGNGIHGDNKNESITKPAPKKVTSLDRLKSKAIPENPRDASNHMAPNGERFNKASNTSKEVRSKDVINQQTADRNMNGAAISKRSTQNSSAGEKQNASVAFTLASQGSIRKRRVIKLKIPKPIRKNCMRILQMPPRPSKMLHNEALKINGKEEVDFIAHDRNTSNESIQNAGRSQRSEQIKAQIAPSAHQTERIADTLEDTPSKRRSGEKRERLDNRDISPNPPSKRQKQPVSLELSQKSHTPIKPPAKSPLFSTGVQRSHLSTPKRDIKSAVMQRIGSSEGDVKTPLGAPRGGTPTIAGSSERTNRDGRSSSNTSASGLSAPANEDSTAWRIEQKRFEALGRSLKHEVNAAHPNANEDFKNDSPTTKQGAAIAFEAALAFILAFTISEEINRLNRQPSDSTPWNSLLPFLNYVKLATQRYRPLLGLTHQLEGVCRDMISLYDAERLERDTSTSGLSNDQRHPLEECGAIHTSASNSEKAKHDLALKHVENLRQAQHAWQIGYSELSLREMQQSFPKTWDMSLDRPGAGKGKEKLTLKNYASGSFYLPLGPTTSGIESVRVAWQVLHEWCDKNEVKWQGKLGF